MQVQPVLGVEFDLPQGFTVSGTHSQRYRDGKADLSGVVYEHSATPVPMRPRLASCAS